MQTGGCTVRGDAFRVMCPPKDVRGRLCVNAMQKLLPPGQWHQRITFLSLTKTKITAAGIDGLKKALPQCKIEWDGGVIEPRP